MNEFEVVELVASAYVVGLSNTPSLQYELDASTMVVDMKPVANIASITVDG